MANPLTPADVTPDMRYRHAGQWRTYYAASLASLTTPETLKFPADIAPAASDLADAALIHELNLIPRLQFLEDKTQPQNTHGH